MRLLTGLGRYSEMTYALDLLHERHCFEMLMRKKLDPVGAQCFGAAALLTLGRLRLSQE